MSFGGCRPKVLLTEDSWHTDVVTFVFPSAGPNFCGCRYYEPDSGYDPHTSDVCICGATPPVLDMSISVCPYQVLLTEVTVAPNIYDDMFKFGIIYELGVISFWLNDVPNPFDIEGCVLPKFKLIDSDLKRLLSVKPDTGVKRILKAMNRTAGFKNDCVPYGKAFNTYVHSKEGLIIVCYADGAIYRRRKIVHLGDEDREKNGILFWVKLDDSDRRGILVGRLRAVYMMLALMRLEWKHGHYSVEYRTTTEQQPFYRSFFMDMMSMVERPGLCRHISVDEKDICGSQGDSEYGKRDFLRMDPAWVAARWSEQ